MNAATEYYGDDWDIGEFHGKESYDLVCCRDHEIKHVEVKGITTGGAR
jgi:hypothetical protein